MSYLEKKKILILYNKLFHYRIPIFNILGSEYELTVAYSFGEEPKEIVNFNKIKLSAHQLNRFVIHKDNIYRICENFDAVIVFGDISWLKYSSLAFFKKRPFKLIFWSPGVSASYEKKFDAVTKWDIVRDFFYKKADALIFYSVYPVDKYVKRGFDFNKLFVAPNTVEVVERKEKKIIEKDSIMFIGTLYFEKGISILLENYKKAFLEDPNLLPLNILGGGKELPRVRQWVIHNNLQDKIFVKGPVYDSLQKAIFFNRAFACISPLQAGLSVLESMGYGVPFITMNDAITGGERLNIIAGETGILMDQTEELKQLILDIQINRGKYIAMGEKARNLYETTHTPQHMANGIISAIEHVLAESKL